LIGRFWLILDTFKNGYSSLNAAHSVNIAQKCTGRISKSKLDNTECNARSSRVVALLTFKLKQIKQVNIFFRHPVHGTKFNWFGSPLSNYALKRSTYI
jgi:hypothetical protein